MIGATFGEGDGETTFNLPDLRGEFIRGWDDTRNVDVDRPFGSIQEDVFQGHGHIVTTGKNDSGNYHANGGIVGHIGNHGSYEFPGKNNKIESDGINGIPRIANETRPRNIALLACIKAFDAATNPGLIDMTELANEVSDKTDRNLSNILPAGIDTCVRWGIPDYKRKVSLSESDFPYTVGKPGLRSVRVAAITIKYTLMMIWFSTLT